MIYQVLNGLTSSQLSNTYKLDQVIENWLTTTESHLVTWETVIDAIKSPIVNNIKKATEIRQHLTKGKLIYIAAVLTISGYNCNYIQCSLQNQHL